MTEYIDTAAVVIAKTVYHIQCPVCEHVIDINWYVELAQGKDPAALPIRGESTCSECDSTYSISIDMKDDEPVIGYSQLPTKQYLGLMLVKHRTENLFLIVENNFYVRKEGVSMDLTYYIDEHTCPTNWLKVLMVTEDGNPDPHGVFRFVRGVLYKDLQSLYGYDREMLRGNGDDSQEAEEALLRIFPEISSEGDFIEGELDTTKRLEMSPADIHDVVKRIR